MTERETIIAEIQAYRVMRSFVDEQYHNALGARQGQTPQKPGPKSAAFRREGLRLTKHIQMLEKELDKIGDE